jgi:hypothetical protein
MLVAKDLRISTRYRLHAHVGGRAVMIELFDRPSGIAPDEHIRFVAEDGRVLSCQVLDDTPMCAVEGEGLFETEG